MRRVTVARVALFSYTVGITLAFSERQLVAFLPSFEHFIASVTPTMPHTMRSATMCAFCAIFCLATLATTVANAFSARLCKPGVSELRCMPVVLSSSYICLGSGSVYGKQLMGQMTYFVQDLFDPGSTYAQRRPPPCPRHFPPDLARRLHPSTVHRVPPPCLTHFMVRPAALRGQPAT